VPEFVRVTSLRIVGGQDYEIADLRRKYPHLSHQQAAAIVRQAKGDQDEADAWALRLLAKEPNQCSG
jgi:hypothetical protein